VNVGILDTPLCTYRALVAAVLVDCRSRAVNDGRKSWKPTTLDEDATTEQSRPWAA